MEAIPIIQLMKKPLIRFVIIFALLLVATLYAEKQSHLLFKIPVLAIDLDQSESSKQWLESINQSTSIDLEQKNAEQAFIQDAVENNQYAAVMVIPEGFEKSLKNRTTKQSVQLIRAEGIVPMIGTEVMSQALYKQQIPYVIEKHLDGQNKMAEIQKQYEKNEPKSKLALHVTEKRESTGNQTNTILVAASFFFLMIQLVIFKRLRQFDTLKRLKIYPKGMLDVLFSYSVVMVITTMIVAKSISLAFNVQFALLSNLLWLAVYQVVVSYFFFKIKTTSHLFFTVFIWTVVMSTFYLAIQLVGGIL